MENERIFNQANNYFSDILNKKIQSILHCNIEEYGWVKSSSNLEEQIIYLNHFSIIINENSYDINDISDILFDILDDVNKNTNFWDVNIDLYWDVFFDIDLKSFNIKNLYNEYIVEFDVNSNFIKI